MLAKNGIPGSPFLSSRAATGSLWAEGRLGQSRAAPLLCARSCSTPGDPESRETEYGVRNSSKAIIGRVAVNNELHGTAADIGSWTADPSSGLVGVVVAGTLIA
jgi:hypothetical protein